MSLFVRNHEWLTQHGMRVTADAVRRVRHWRFDDTEIVVAYVERGRARLIDVWHRVGDDYPHVGEFQPLTFMNPGQVVFDSFSALLAPIHISVGEFFDEVREERPHDWNR